MSALPAIDLTDDLHRQAVREVQEECLWSTGLMAYELHSDPTTLRRWLAADPPESPFQEKQEARLIANVAAFLATYRGPVIVKRRVFHPVKITREYELLPSGRRNPLVTTCPHGHPYSTDNTGYYPKGRRYCLTCKQERRRA